LKETVAHILEADIPASAAYAQLKAELTRMHETAWDWLAKLFALLPCGAQKGTELLAAMERLKPEDPELWIRWMYFSRSGSSASWPRTHRRSESWQNG